MLDLLTIYQHVSVSETDSEIIWIMDSKNLPSIMYNDIDNTVRGFKDM